MSPGSYLKNLGVQRVAPRAGRNDRVPLGVQRGVRARSSHRYVPVCVPARCIGPSKVKSHLVCGSKRHRALAWQNPCPSQRPLPGQDRRAIVGEPGRLVSLFGVCAVDAQLRSSLMAAIDRGVGGSLWTVHLCTAWRLLLSLSSTPRAGTCARPPIDAGRQCAWLPSAGSTPPHVMRYRRPPLCRWQPSKTSPTPPLPACV
mmetsp:Transcript_23136/g.54804  ORF Transcript_23136/g.54804 Transcript_23136/m.54804 type:complete len:201 (+) Transcript_23136:439-1041(+)